MNEEEIYMYQPNLSNFIQIGFKIGFKAFRLGIKINMYINF